MIFLHVVTLFAASFTLKGCGKKRKYLDITFHRAIFTTLHLLLVTGSVNCGACFVAALSTSSEEISTWIEVIIYNTFIVLTARFLFTTRGFRALEMTYRRG